MEQRRLRLGDILDDYCPRERRVTNHAVVAMVEEDVKQTRCTTCDAEHVYKGGKAPRRKKAETTSALYKEVLAGITDQEPATPAAATPMSEHSDDPEAAQPPDVETDAAVAASPEEPAAQEEDVQPSLPDDGSVHRPLIRAQLPRPEGIKIERQAPEFTIRQNGGRGGNGGFRGGDMRARGGRGGGGSNNGHRFGRGPNRGGGHQGFGRGPGGPGGPSRGPRKRSR